MTDRLYRSSREKMLGGVCGGLAEYFQVDVTLVRLITMVAMFAGGVGFLVYLVAWILIPPNPADRDGYVHHYNRGVEEVVNDVADNIGEAARNIGDAARNFGEAARNGLESGRSSGEYRRGTKLAGLVLIVLGLLFFLDRWFPLWFSMSKMWPLILILIGLAIIWRGEKR